jgi:hypothetical protein
MATNHTLWIHAIKIHCGSMREISNQDDIATRHTEWIYVLQIIHTASQPGLQR